jgi:hypothetical protein
MRADFAPTQAQVAAYAGIIGRVRELERLAIQVDSVRVNPKTLERLGGPYYLNGLRVWPDSEVPAATFVVCLAPVGLPEMLEGSKPR